ncbi:hypothetical protein [Klebsiella phage YC1]|nr:hypothetical protein [Klebsiella phage YC1]
MPVTAVLSATVNLAALKDKSLEDEVLQAIKERMAYEKPDIELTLSKDNEVVNSYTFVSGDALTVSDDFSFVFNGIVTDVISNAN